MACHHLIEEVSQLRTITLLCVIGLMLLAGQPSSPGRELRLRPEGQFLRLPDLRLGR